MTVHQALYHIISNMEYGKCRRLTGDDLKWHVEDLMGIKPKDSEFREAIESMKKLDELHFISSSRGYFRTKVKNHLKEKGATLIRQINNRQTELLTVRKRLHE